MNFPNLHACVVDVAAALTAPAEPPALPADHGALLARLVAARERLPPLYRERALDPYLARLTELGPQGHADALRRGLGGLFGDAAQALLQRCEGFASPALEALQEVVSDLFDGFLSAEDRRGVRPPDHDMAAPLVKWGARGPGPYAYAPQATAPLGLQVGLVSLPLGGARGALLAWPAMSHETGGHGLLEADEGLIPELRRAIAEAVAQGCGSPWLGAYWAARAPEVAADVVGALNLGPAAALGQIGYFRAQRWLSDGAPRLRRHSRPGDRHPADLLRGWLLVGVVARLRFAGAAAWAEALCRELDRDCLGPLWLEDAPCDVDLAYASAAQVAATVADRPLAALEGHALSEIQNWRDEDERLATTLGEALLRGGEVPTEALEGAYAAHVVAAAVTRAATGADPRRLHARMLAALADMHARNPSWGPLKVVHPGDIAPLLE